MAIGPGPLRRRLLISTSAALVIPWFYVIYMTMVPWREISGDDIVISALFALVSFLMAGGGALIGITIRGRN
jgi:hypothetical protein